MTRYTRNILIITHPQKKIIQSAGPDAVVYNS